MLSSLRDARLSHDPPLRLCDVAQKAGVSISLVSMVEAGYPSTERTRSAIAAAVGASHGSFWDDGNVGVRAVTPLRDMR